MPDISAHQITVISGSGYWQASIDHIILSPDTECVCRLQEALLQPLLGAARAQARAVPDVPALRWDSF